MNGQSDACAVPVNVMMRRPTLIGVPTMPVLSAPPRSRRQRRSLIAMAQPYLKRLGLGAIPDLATTGGRRCCSLEIRLAGQTLFFYAMEGTAPVNADWARRKRNVAELHGRSSYAVGLTLKRDGESLEEKLGLPARDYAAHGGSFPLALEGAGLVGTITVSGLPQREDHALIVAVLADYLGLPSTELALN